MPSPSTVVSNDSLVNACVAMPAFLSIVYVRCSACFNQCRPRTNPARRWTGCVALGVAALLVLVLVLVLVLALERGRGVGEGEGGERAGSGGVGPGALVWVWLPCWCCSAGG